MNTIKTVKRSKIKKVNAPFGYFGSKNKIALELCDQLPPHNCWVEAFCGSAALTLRKLPADIEVINDIDSNIVNVFEQLRNNFDELYRVIELTPYAEEELILARTLPTGEISNLERARRFLVQSMMSVNGIFGEDKGGFSYSDSYTRNGHDARVNRWNNLPERLTYVVERLKSVRVENKDAKKLLERYVNRPATLVYLDPPYLGERTNGYNKDANDEQFHRELLAVSNEAKCMIFISGYENELYDTLLTAKGGWQKRLIETITKDTKGNSHARTEVVWANKHFQKALETQKVPIVLTEKEKKQGKVNPER
ncbi:MAG TPA: DNA adenine methylase [Chitinophagaceae bacterium]|nr:DNA adenine methylase [Chitinophagaceae bacterium]